MANSKSSKSTPVIEEVAVEEVAPVTEEVVETPAVVEVPEEVVLTPATKKGTVTGTWTLYYANVSYDFVAGQEYELPVAVYEYLRRAGNLKATL